MEYVMLGRTGLRVSVAGLGCGGFSRLGLGTGKSNAEAVALVRQALDMGVNLLDTAAAYGTEAIVGEAIKHVPCFDQPPFARLGQGQVGPVGRKLRILRGGDVAGLRGEVSYELAIALPRRAFGCTVRG